MKPHGKFRDPATKEKYARIAARYEEMGRRFRVMTDLDVSSEPLFTTLKILNYHWVGKAIVATSLFNSSSEANFSTTAILVDIDELSFLLSNIRGSGIDS